MMLAFPSFHLLENFSFSKQQLIFHNKDAFGKTYESLGKLAFLIQEELPTFFEQFSTYKSCV